MRCAAFVATSLDGYIAREDGRIDWLETANASIPPGEDCGYGAFMSDIDAIVMGRGTYETVLGFPEWPFGQLPVVILSSGLLSLPEHLPPTVSPSAEALGALLDRLERQGLHNTAASPSSASWRRACWMSSPSPWCLSCSAAGAPCSPACPVT